MKWLKNNKGKLAAVLVIVILLVISLFSGGLPPENNEKSEEITASQEMQILKDSQNTLKEKRMQAEKTAFSENVQNESTKKVDKNETDKVKASDVQKSNVKPENSKIKDVKQQAENISSLPEQKEESSYTEKENPEEKTDNEQSESSADTGASADNENESKTDKTEDRSETVLPENEEIKDTKLRCTLSVRCDTINQNIELLNEAKRRLIPSDGIIFKPQEVVFSQGESVFDVLLRELKNNKIHFEYVNMPIYDSAYIEGINNIYEFDCGELSGWLYRVNGLFPNYGCSQYKVKNGDVIELVYTCDMGKDVGKN